MKKYILFIFYCMFSFSAGIAAAQDDQLRPEQIFDTAVLKYERGEYASAVRDIEAILESGIRSGNIYYNLGNCYLKDGKLGKAILSYERARLFMPRDSDLLSNLRYAMSLVKQKEPAKSGLWIVKSLDVLLAYFTLGEAYFIAMALYYLIVMLILTCIFNTNARRYSIFGIIILSVFLAAVIIPLQRKIAQTEILGVVVSDITDAKFGPTERAAINYPLFAGMHVDILATRGEWRKIKRLDGKIGWVPRDSVSLILE